MDPLVWVQILGILTLFVYVVSLQQRKKESFLLLQVGGTVLFIIQYLLTGKITAVITFAIIAIRGVVFYFYKKKNLQPSLAVFILFQAVLLVSTVLTWQDAFSLIPYVAAAAKTWGTWQDDMKWTRRTSLLGQSLMIVYNLSAAMYTGALTEVCNVTSTLIAMWRYDWRTKTDRKA